MGKWYRRNARNSWLFKFNPWDTGNEAVFPLSRGNYVIASQHWDDGTKVDAGAITFANGKTGITGTIDSSNSLVGKIDSEMTGKYGVLDRQQ